jgi:hypothetical protein
VETDESTEAVGEPAVVDRRRTGVEERQSVGGEPEGSVDGTVERAPVAETASVPCPVPFVSGKSSDSWTPEPV